MLEIDRFDICEGHYWFEAMYNIGGIVIERPSNRRRLMSTHFQLCRMGFRLSRLASFDNMSDNARFVYDALVEKYFA